jgi:hypothetical protein
MATVITDVIDGSRGELTVHGWDLERIAIVTGVSGDGHAKVINATNDAGMPNIGDAHPSRSTCYLTRISPEQLTSEEVHFRLYYSDRGIAEFGWAPDTIQGNCTVSQQDVNVDADNYLTQVSYTYPADYAYDANLANTEVIHTQFVPKLIPELILTIKKIEYSNPSAVAREYIGTVNLAGWAGDWTATARTWLCTGIDWISHNQGISYEVVYTFQYRPDGWDSTLNFIDPHTNEVPPDIDTNPSAYGVRPGPPYCVTSYQMYTMKDFGLLTL